jgi:hypothetical protein
MKRQRGAYPGKRLGGPLLLKQRKGQTVLHLEIGGRIGEQLAVERIGFGKPALAVQRHRPLEKRLRIHLGIHRVMLA